MTRSSLARRLFFSAAIWSSLVLLVAGFALSALNARSTINAFDERLSIYLLEIVADLSLPNEFERRQVGDLSEPRFEFQNSGWYWQAVRLDGGERVVAASKSLYGERLPTLTAQQKPGEIKYALRGTVPGPEGRTLRMVERRVDLGEEGQFLVSVAADSDDVQADIAEFRLALGLTFLVLLVALVASTGFQVVFGLRPLRELVGSVAAVRQGKADRIGGTYPPELAPLAGELNLLIDTNRGILERARTQVGNLAHALKTPLSVLVNEAATNPGGLADKVDEQATVMRHHIDYHLNRARVAALAGALGTATEVKPVVEGLVRVFTKLAQGRVAFSAAVPEALKFRGEKQDLEEMVGNLVDNAGKWAATQVTIAAQPVSGGGKSLFEFVIDNDGPPLSAEERQAVLKRGHRADETKPGSGLGLSIVGDLAGMYGGRVELADSPLGGVRARLELPAV